MVRGGRCWVAPAARLSAAAGLLTMTAVLAAGPTYIIGPISDLSGSRRRTTREIKHGNDLGHSKPQTMLWMRLAGGRLARRRWPSRGSQVGDCEPRSGSRRIRLGYPAS